MLSHLPFPAFVFFHAAATTAIYTLSLHDALPIFAEELDPQRFAAGCREDVDQTTADGELAALLDPLDGLVARERSEEHTSELQSHHDLVCRLLLEKKNDKRSPPPRYATSRISPPP